LVKTGNAQYIFNTERSGSKPNRTESAMRLRFSCYGFVYPSMAVWTPMRKRLPDWKWNTPVMIIKLRLTAVTPLPNILGSIVNSVPATGQILGSDNKLFAADFNRYLLSGFIPCTPSV